MQTTIIFHFLKIALRRVILRVIGGIIGGVLYIQALFQGSLTVELLQDLGDGLNDIIENTVSEQSRALARTIELGDGVPLTGYVLAGIAATVVVERLILWTYRHLKEKQRIKNPEGSLG